MRESGGLLATMYDERERNLRANPQLLRTNLPYRLIFTIIAAVVILITAHRFWAPAVAIVGTELTTLGKKTVVKMEVTNRSASRIAVAIEVSIGHSAGRRGSGSRFFRVSSNKRVSGFVEPRSSQTVECEFEGVQSTQPNHAEARIVETSLQQR